VNSATGAVRGRHFAQSSWQIRNGMLLGLIRAGRLLPFPAALFERTDVTIAAQPSNRQRIRQR
jgi:hypothetical protein